MTIDVTAANDAPTATNLTQSHTLNEDSVSPLDLTNIVVSDPDTGDTITATLTLSNASAGTLSANDGATFVNGVWTKTGTVSEVNTALSNAALSLAGNWDTDFTIAARIRDAADTGPSDGTISIHVIPSNDAPTATNLTQSHTLNEDSVSPLDLTNIVVSDPDTGDTITATLTLSNASAGTLSANDGATFVNGVWTKTGTVSEVNTALSNAALSLAGNWDTDFTIAARIRDAADTGPSDGTISIHVIPSNDAPTSQSQSVSVNEDDTLTITLTGYDVDHPAVTDVQFVLTSQVLHGTLTATGSVVQDSMDHTKYTQQYHYTPSANYNGSDNFQFKLMTLPQPWQGFGSGANISGTGVYAESVVLADVNHDGKLDLIEGNFGGVNKVYLGNGDGTFTWKSNLGTAGDNTYSISVGDVNHDGNLDVAAGSWTAPCKVYLGNGDGTFQTGIDIAASTPTRAIALGDVNGDHEDDVVIGGTNVRAAEVYTSNGNGYFTYKCDLGGSADWTESIALGDVNNDGKLDVVAGNSWASSKAYLGNGDGTFQAGVAIGTTALYHTTSIALGDVNGDGKLDVVKGNQGLTSEVYLGNGDGTFTYKSAIDASANSTVSIALGDVNGDGKLDVVQGIWTGSNKVYLGNGDGTFTYQGAVGSGSNKQRIALGDVDNDSDLDVVVGRENQLDQVFQNPGYNWELSSAAAVSITVTSVNDAPTDITLSTSSVSENLSSGTAVGTFSTTDADSGDSHTYILVPDAGDTDNESFTIDSGVLKTAASFDYETKNSYSIRVQTDDGNGGTFQKVFAVTVNNVNEAPTVETPISNVTVNENAADTVFSLYPNFQDAENTDGQLTYTVVNNTNPGLFGSVGNPLPVTKWTPADLAANDHFGNSVSIDGNYAIVGSMLDDDNGNNSGSAYILHWTGTTWVQQQKLTGSNGSGFGASVYIKGDHAIVGSVWDGPGGVSMAGSASIFKFNGTSWVQEAYITASDKAGSDYFGTAVSIDGDYAIVGVRADDNAAGPDAGGAYIFHWTGTEWVQQAKLTASDGAGQDYFGNSVSINGGEYAVVGAVLNDDQGTGDSGAVYIFHRNGATWEQQVKLTAWDKGWGDNFGDSVAKDGDYLVVGASGDDTPAGANAGSVYIFHWNGTTWENQARLMASDGASNDYFGSKVAINGDYVVVGSPNDDTSAGTDAGSVYVFKRDGTHWAEQSHFIPSGTAANDNFGSTVGISNNVVIAGVSADDDPTAGVDAGSVYMLTLNNTTNVVSDPTNFGLHYVSDANGSADITVRATDTGGLYVDQTFHVTVNAVNDAPVLINNGAFAAHGTEDVTNLAGQSVSGMIAGTITDADSAALQGIAVIGVDNAHGTWQFSVDDGSHWTSFGTVSDTSATVLKDLSTTKVRFAPNADWNGTAGISYRAWDQTNTPALVDGATGVNVSTNGGSTPYSNSTAASAIITVDPVNDAPVNNLPWAALAADIVSGATGSDPQYLTVSGGNLYFTAYDSVHGRELWKTDGTAAGTMLVKDINPGSADSTPLKLTDVNGTLYFQANDGTNGVELWKSDGTPNGTVIVKDIYSGSTGSNPDYLRNVNGALFFAATDPTHGTEIWESNGTQAGTILVKDIVVGSGSSSPLYMTTVNTKVFFWATTPGYGYQLWKSEPSGQADNPATTDIDESWNTVMVKDIYHNWDGGVGAGPYPDMLNFNGTLFFSCRDFWNGNDNRALYKTDGTVDGTVAVTGDWGGLSHLTDMGGYFLFTWGSGSIYRYDDVNGVTLVSSNGTTEIVNFNGIAYFPGLNVWVQDGGVELLKTDGTAAGTTLAVDIATTWPYVSSSPHYLTVADNTLFFVASPHPSVSDELFRSDGTPAGTVMLDINPGSASSSPYSFAAFNNMIFFSADDGTHGRELWKAAGHGGPSTYVASTDEDAPIVFSGNRQISVSDVDALGTDTMQVTLTAMHGTLTLGNPSLVSFNFTGDSDGSPVNDGTSDVTMTFRGTKTNINSALNNLVFTPDANYNGDASIQIITKDLGHNGSGGTLQDSDTIAITVNPVNDAPTDIALSGSSVNENLSSGTAVGTFASTDQDTGQTYTYSLVSGTGGADNASFIIEGNTLKTAASFDYETKTSYSILVQTDDGHGGTFQKVFSITVNNVNDAPTDVALSASNVNENQPSGTAVGTFSATDQDGGPSYTYTLVSGTGSTDNASFTIVGNTLKTAASFDYETKTSYSVRVQTDDGNGGSFQKVFAVTVNNVNEAPVNNIPWSTLGASIAADVVPGSDRQQSPEFDGVGLLSLLHCLGFRTRQGTLENRRHGSRHCFSQRYQHGQRRQHASETDRCQRDALLPGQ